MGDQLGVEAEKEQRQNGRGRVELLSGPEGQGQAQSQGQQDGHHPAGKQQGVRRHRVLVQELRTKRGVVRCRPAGVIQGELRLEEQWRERIDDFAERRMFPIDPKISGLPIAVPLARSKPSSQV